MTSVPATFWGAREAYADARWQWHLARERGEFIAMLDAEIRAAAAREGMDAALARMGFDQDFRTDAVRDFATEEEELAAMSPFWRRIARGETQSP